VSLVAVKAGALTTVQDLGRRGFRHLGVGAAGALDTYSLQVANLLVRNKRGAAGLEITLSGPTLRFEKSATIAITGASIDAAIDGVALAGWRPIDVPAGSELKFGACRDGARSYLAIAGGVSVAAVLGSASTDLRAGFGGLEGRALRSGDRIEFPAGASIDALSIAAWWVDALPDLDLAHEAAVSVLPASDATAPHDALFAQAWRVSAASDRQGLRLEGPALQLADTRERLSAPVAPGAVQLPPNGKPIVLLGDAQTVGGYPCIGFVATADLPRLAQCRPGDALHFRPIDHAAAHRRLREQSQRLARMELAVAQRTSACRRASPAATIATSRTQD
jgi:biotin-dependent carboxylase-like uncharacterized protein